MDDTRKAMLVHRIKERLIQIGYSVTDEDVNSIEFMLDYTLNYIFIQTNNPTIDSKCDTAIAEKVAAEFLLRKKNMGKLESFDYDRGVKAITEGDTKVEFLTGDDAMTYEARFDRCLNEMIRGFDKRVISPFRKLRW